MRHINLNYLETLRRVVTTAGTPVLLAPYQVASTFTFAAGTSHDTITDSGSGFLTAGFRAGDILVVSGSASNDGEYEIYSVTAGTITIVRYGTLVTEAAGSAITLTAKHGFPVEDGVSVIVKAKNSNTGNIYLANTSARAVSTNNYYQSSTILSPNEAVGVQVKNLNQLWIDSAVNGDGVEIIFEC